LRHLWRISTCSSTTAQAEWEDFDGAMVQEGSYRIKVLYADHVSLELRCGNARIARGMGIAADISRLYHQHSPQTFSTTIRTPSSSSALSAAMDRIFGIHVWA
jgi:hypothetical protein